MPVVRLNGAEIYYEEHGAGFPVAFVHGAGGNHLSWWQQVAHFSRRYRCITYDQRGWGLSLDADGSGPAAFADDLRALLDRLGVDEAFLVAQSMGGIAATAFTLRAPGRVRGLVLANTFAGMRREVWLAAGEDVRAQARGIWERRQADGVRRALSRSFSARHRELAFLYKEIRLLNEHGPNSGHAARRVDRYRALERSGELAFTREQLASLDVPVLFIGGEEDDVMPVVLMEIACGFFPRARMVVVPGAGHSVYFEQPAVFNEHVQAFFAECSARAGRASPREDAGAG